MLKIARQICETYEAARPAENTALEALAEGKELESNILRAIEASLDERMDHETKCLAADH